MHIKVKKNGLEGLMITAASVSLRGDIWSGLPLSLVSPCPCMGGASFGLHWRSSQDWRV